MTMNIGIPVRLKVDFSVVRETLERVGIKNINKKEFYPSCYCVETATDGIYRIVHFKELFPLFNRESTYNSVDTLRLKTIVQLLAHWNLVEPQVEIDEIMSEKVAVLKHQEKKDYNIIHKFKFSKKIVLES